MSEAGEMPPRPARERDAVPSEAIIWLAAAGAAASLLPGITELVAFGSLTFLVVFGLVNMVHARHSARPGSDRVLALAAAAACALAGALLVFELARSDRPALALIVVCSLALVVARTAYARRRIPRVPPG